MKCNLRLVFSSVLTQPCLLLLRLSPVVLVAADAVWDAGDRPGRLAEEHHLQTLHQEQQADPLVLAGTVLQWAPSAVMTMCEDWPRCVPAGGEGDGQREENPSASVCNGNVSAARGRLRRAHRYTLIQTICELNISHTSQQPAAFIQ